MDTSIVADRDTSVKTGEILCAGQWVTTDWAMGWDMYIDGMPSFLVPEGDARDGYNEAQRCHAYADASEWMEAHTGAWLDDEPAIEDDYEWIRGGC